MLPSSLPLRCLCLSVNKVHVRGHENSRHRMQPIRLAVVGAGVMGEKHTELITAGSCCSLAGICDIDVSRKYLADQFNVPFYDNVEELLEREEPDRGINLYINSPGGVISSGLAIYDTMRLVNCEVSTICLGMAASMATVLLSGGQKGKRYALPNSTIHMHQAVGGAQGQAADIEIQAREIMRLQDKLRGIISEQTGQAYDKVAQDTDRDYFLTPEQALEYGLIDEVMSSRPKEVK